MSEIESLVAQGAMRASFTAPREKVFKIKRKTGEPIHYCDITSHGWIERCTNEFSAGVFGIFGVGLLGPAIEAQTRPPQRKFYCDSDRMFRYDLNKVEISVEDIPTERERE